MEIKRDKNELNLYHVWNKMKDRCYKPKCKDFKYYGERGIKVCDEWKQSFSAFKDWALNHGYKQLLTIDRIDADGNYEPSNCRWVDRRIQGNNRRNNIRLEYKGIIHTVTEWAQILNISPDNIYWYYHKGLTLKDILIKKGVVTL